MLDSTKILQLRELGRSVELSALIQSGIPGKSWSSSTQKFLCFDRSEQLTSYLLLNSTWGLESVSWELSISKHALHISTDGHKTVSTVDFFCDLLVIPLRASAASGLRQATRLWAWREMAAVSRMVSLFCPMAHTQQLELFPGSWDTFSFLLTEESVTSV